MTSWRMQLDLQDAVGSAVMEAMYEAKRMILAPHTPVVKRFLADSSSINDSSDNDGISWRHRSLRGGILTQLRRSGEQQICARKQIYGNYHQNQPFFI